MDPSSKVAFVSGSLKAVPLGELSSQEAVDIIQAAIDRCKPMLGYMNAFVELSDQLNPRNFGYLFESLSTQAGGGAWWTDESVPSYTEPLLATTRCHCLALLPVTYLGEDTVSQCQGLYIDRAGGYLLATKSVYVGTDRPFGRRMVVEATTAEPLAELATLGPVFTQHGYLIKNMLRRLAAMSSDSIKTREKIISNLRVLSDALTEMDERLSFR